ncbi:MAG TPA: MFS transporter, partial [Actinophytocola sp.]|nr:MFS transporter [Actinophytocola sp.]
AVLGGRAARLRPLALAGLLGVGVALFGLAVLLRLPVGVAGIAVFYGLYRMVVVVVDAALQRTIEGPARATVTSVAGLGIEVVAVLVFVAWAVGAAPLVTGLLLLTVIALPRLHRDRAKDVPVG